MLRISRIPSDTAVDPAGASRYFPGGTTGVLVIHGWTGCVGEMAYLASQLASAGFTVNVPRLPGHGTNGADFLQSTWQDWLRKAVDSYLDLARECDVVYVAGLSMGGILTALLASLFDVPRIALFAPAIVNSNPLIRLTPVARFLAKRYRIPFEEEDTDPVLLPLAREYHSYQWIAPAYHLRRLQKLARRRLWRITADTLIVVSAGDESVPVSVADLVAKNSRARDLKRIDLVESDHVLVNGVEKERVAEETVAWFRQPSTTGLRTTG